MTNGKPSNGVAERKQLSSVSTALLLAVVIGIIEALALYFGAGKFLDLMGISSVSFFIYLGLYNMLINHTPSFPSLCTLYTDTWTCIIVHVCEDICMMHACEDICMLPHISMYVHVCLCSNIQLVNYPFVLLYWCSAFGHWSIWVLV